jgi:hypothetical protein
LTKASDGFQYPITSLLSVAFARLLATVNDPILNSPAVSFAGSTALAVLVAPEVLDILLPVNEMGNVNEPNVLATPAAPSLVRRTAVVVVPVAIFENVDAESPSPPVPTA